MVPRTVREPGQFDPWFQKVLDTMFECSAISVARLSAMSAATDDDSMSTEI